MFRKSDMVEKNPHKVHQQMPLLQATSRATNFDRGFDESNISHETYPPEPIPVKCDAKFHPTHVDADWAGLVAAKSHRRHILDHRALGNGLMQTEQGIVSSSEKGDWLLKRRDKSVVFDTSLTGSIGGFTDGDHWKTSTQRMNDGVPTTKDQLTLDKRSNPRRNLATISLRENPVTATNPAMVQSGYSSGRFSSDTRIGTSRPTGRNGSMLTNIGQALAADIHSSTSNPT